MRPSAPKTLELVGRARAEPGHERLPVSRLLEASAADARGLFQLLKSPTTLMARALGSHTAKCTPLTPSCSMTRDPELVERLEVRAFARAGEGRSRSAYGAQTLHGYFSCGSTTLMNR